MGYSRIARTLNAEGALAPKPKRVRDSSGKLQATRSPGWSHSTVKVILDRRLYLGEAVWNRTKKRDKRGKKIRGRKLPLRPESEWIRTAAPPIITETEWRTAHDRLDTVRARLQGLRQDDENAAPAMLNPHSC